MLWRGNPRALLGIVGEAPGADEDREGFPFVGRSGKLVDSVLDILGLSEDHVWIANVVGCRPPHNRDPAPDELSACRDRLSSMLWVVKPKVLLVLGGVAMRRLVANGAKISKIRGEIREAEIVLERRVLRIPAIVTYHPAYVLRSGKEIRDEFTHDLRTAATLAGLLEAA